MKIRRFYIIEHKGRTIDISRDALLLGPMPVLWCNGGMYALIPGAILEDLFDSTDGIGWMQTFYWEQTYKLESDVGRLLCDQSYDQSNNSS